MLLLSNYRNYLNKINARQLYMYVIRGLSFAISTQLDFVGIVELVGIKSRFCIDNVRNRRFLLPTYFNHFFVYKE